MDYLGHQISAQGVSVDPINIQVVLDWPKPTTVKGMCGFLGLDGYYQKFIRHFGNIAAPVTQLLAKESFHWTVVANQAFTQLKEALTSPPVLCLPKFSQQFVVECDANGIGLGAILSQNSRPMA